MCLLILSYQHICLHPCPVAIDHLTSGQRSQSHMETLICYLAVLYLVAGILIMNRDPDFEQKSACL